MNVHTIKDGQFVRTLVPIDCTGPSINITFLALSYQGNCNHVPQLKLMHCSNLPLNIQSSSRSHRIFGRR